MKKFKFNLITILFLILSFSAIVFATLDVFIFKDKVVSLGENGVLEHMQLALLGMTIIYYLISSIRNNGGERWISLCAVAVFYIFAIRESDIKNIEEVPQWAKYILHDPGRWIVGASLITASIISALPEYKHYISKSIELLFSPRGVLLLLAFIFLQVGAWMEHVQFDFNKYASEFCEESLELIGYCFILICADKTLKLRPSKGKESSYKYNAD